MNLSLFLFTELKHSFSKVQEYQSKAAHGKENSVDKYISPITVKYILSLFKNLSLIGSVWIAF